MIVLTNGIDARTLDGRGVGRGTGSGKGNGAGNGDGRGYRLSINHKFSNGTGDGKGDGVGRGKGQFIKGFGYTNKELKHT